MVGPGVVDSGAPAFAPQLPQELLGFGVTDVQVDVDVPDLQASVGLLDQVQLLLELLPLEGRVLSLGVDGSDDQLGLSSRECLTLIKYDLCADYLFVVESFPGLLRFNALLLQDNDAFAVVLVLVSNIRLLLDLVFCGDRQLVAVQEGFFRGVNARFDVHCEVRPFLLEQAVVPFQLVHVLAIGLQPVDVLEHDGESFRVAFRGSLIPGFVLSLVNFS